MSEKNEIDIERIGPRKGGALDRRIKQRTRDTVALVRAIFAAAPPTKGIVYFAYAERSRLIKIGWTLNLKKRTQALVCACGSDVEIIVAYSGTKNEERKCHELFAKLRTKGEWFEDMLALRYFVNAISRRARAA